MLLAPTPSGIGAAFSFGSVFPVEAEMYSTVQIWFISVISGELQKSLTRPNVEVKFSNMTFEIPFIKGEGQILAICSLAVACYGWDWEGWV